MSRSRFISCVVLLIAVLAISACGPKAPPEATPETPPEAPPEAVTEEVVSTEVSEVEVEQTLIIGMALDTGPLDVQDPTYAYQNFIPSDMVYDPLVRYGANGEIVPALAESWEISDDGLRWTFHLREGVTFHDGTPFNAEVAKWNLERILGVSAHKWMPTYNFLDSIEAPDDHTLVLAMNKFYYASIQDLALPRPMRFMSPNAVDANGEFVSAIGTGPWKLEEYVPEQRTVLVRNEDYWGEKPYLEKVILNVIPDMQTRVAALLSGDIQLTGGRNIGSIPAESIPTLEENPNVQLVTGQGDSTFFLYGNYTRPPFDDVLVRQALNHAVDREALSTLLYKGLANPAQGFMSETVPYVTFNSEYYTFDLDLAGSMLAEAGWTPGADGILEKDGQRFEIVYLLDEQSWPQAKTVAEVLQAQWLELGIDMQISTVDRGAWNEAMANRDFDLTGRSTWGAPYDPHSSMGLFKSGEGVHATLYSDETLEAMIDEVLATVDEELRQERWSAIWLYLDENGAAIPIITPIRLYALDNSVTGFELAGSDYEIDLAGVRIEGSN